MLWIGIVDHRGALVKQLRNWSYGYATAELLTANGHHVVWCLYTGALDPTPHYYVTDLDSGVEREFTNNAAHMLLSAEVMASLPPTDIAFFTGANAKLFTPEFSGRTVCRRSSTSRGASRRRRRSRRWKNTPICPVGRRTEHPDHQRSDGLAPVGQVAECMSRRVRC